MSASDTQTGIAYPVVRELIASLATARAEVRAGAPDSIHGMRVNVRRLRAALGAFRRTFDEAAVADVRDRLRLLGSVLGTARDLEVRAASAETVLSGLDESVNVNAARERVVGGSWAEFASAHDRVLAYLDSDAYIRLSTELGDLLETGNDHSEPTPDEVVGHELRRTWKRVKRERAQAAGSVAELGALHEVRKAARRLRYTAEAIAAQTPKHQARFLAPAQAAEAVQDRLGEHRDGTLLAEFLLFESKRAFAASEDTFALGAAWQESLRTAAIAREASDTAIRTLKRIRHRW